MRWLALAILVLAAPARADGAFVEEAIGGVSYHGDLARTDGGGPRFQIGFGYRRGAWTVMPFAAFADPGFYAIDCYGDECIEFERPKAAFGMVGADLRKQWPLFRPRWSHTGVSMYLHGGPRWVTGDDALAGFRGPGVGAGAGIAGDLWVIGYFLDFGIDAMYLRGPAPPERTLFAAPVRPYDRDLVGTAPYVVFGAKLGWM